MTIIDFPIKFHSSTPSIIDDFVIFSGKLETLSRPSFDDSQFESRRQVLLQVLRKTQDRLKELLSPDQELLWGGVHLRIDSFSGIERLARLVKIENNSYIVNLHRTYNDMLRDDDAIRKLMNELAHIHPWGDMAVAVLRGKYYMGVGIGELTLPPNIFIEGIVETGDIYFMSEKAYHSLAPLAPEICSMTVHKRLSTKEYGSADFSRITQLSSESKSRLFNYFRQVLC